MLDFILNFQIIVLAAALFKYFFSKKIYQGFVNFEVLKLNSCWNVLIVCVKNQTLHFHDYIKIWYKNLAPKAWTEYPDSNHLHLI